MAWRRVSYWGGVSSLVAVWLMDTGDDHAACGEAAASAGRDEWAPNGLSVLPPGYHCLYIRGEEIVPLDLGGWVEWIALIAVPVLLLYGLASFGLRMHRRHAPQPADA